MFGLIERLMSGRRLAVALPGIVIVAAALLASMPARAQQQPVWLIEGADAARGRALVEPFGCANCHSIPGVAAARGNVGPPLSRFATRTFIAGMLRNEPQNLLRWLRDPQAVVPGNAMPDVGLTDAQARDVAAFLYTLR